MEKDNITEDKLLSFRQYLICQEKSAGTISKYLRDICKFRDFLGKNELNKQNVLQFKEYLQHTYALRTANSILSALNSWFSFIDRADLKVRSFRMVKEIFRTHEQELTREEYVRLLEAAKAENNERLYYIMQVLAATGIRISELRFITISALNEQMITVYAKGKARTVLLPPKLCVKLKQYCYKNQIKHGSVFITKNGKAIDRSNVWAEMKKICPKAHVSKSKVFPHNFRHLFAVTFYQTTHDITKLADLLGHASIDTTRIYLKESVNAHFKQIERLNLII